MKLKLSHFFYIDFMILMIALGCSDAVRGVFAPIFKDHFALSPTDLSLIITVSYVGNLFFMLAGTRLADLFGLRRIFIISIACWMLALACYLVTDSFIALLIGMFMAMGTSTLLNIMMNICSPLVFAAPSMIINTLFFTQGIGTTFTQSVISSNVSDFSDWKLVNLGLLIFGAVSLLLFIKLSKGYAPFNRDKNQEAAKDAAPEEKVSYFSLFASRTFWFMVLIFGTYFVAEHGIMNWMNLYCIESHGMSPAQAAVFPSLFFGGMTLGRLLLSGFVARLGIIRSLTVFLGLGSVVYLVAFLLGGVFYYLFGLAGFLLSILYPTLTLSLQLYFKPGIVASATGTIMAVATVFDIAFNACFGSIIESIGFSSGMLLMPAAMVTCFVLYAVFNIAVKPQYILKSAGKA